MTRKLGVVLFLYIGMIQPIFTMNNGFSTPVKKKSTESSQKINACLFNKSALVNNVSCDVKKTVEEKSSIEEKNWDAFVDRIEQAKKRFRSNNDEK